MSDINLLITPTLMPSSTSNPTKEDLLLRAALFFHIEHEGETYLINACAPETVKEAFAHQNGEALEITEISDALSCGKILEKIKETSLKEIWAITKEPHDDDEKSDYKIIVQPATNDMKDILKRFIEIEGCSGSPEPFAISDILLFKRTVRFGDASGVHIYQKPQTAHRPAAHLLEKTEETPEP